MAASDTINMVLGPVLNPFLSLNPLLSMAILSLVLAFLITVIYKYMTDQELMKTLKDDMKKMQEEMKKLRDNPTKMMEVQKVAMEKNMKYMMHSMKPTLVTFIPLILIFGWLSANFSYVPIAENQKFSTYIFLDNEDVATNATIIVPEGLTLLSEKTAQVKKIDAADNPDKLPFKDKDITSKRYGGIIEKETDVYYAGWDLKGKEGEYNVEYQINGQSYYKDILVSKTRYLPPIKKEEDRIVKGILVDQGKLIVLDLFGWKLGWLGTYIIFSIISSIVLRKVMNVH